jgi:hypothetical protein
MDRRCCAMCGQRKALFFQRLTGKFVWRRDHDLCRQCWRSEVDRVRASGAGSQRGGRPLPMVAALR